MILFSVILLATFFCLHKDDNDGMEKMRLLPIRGILCVLIALHHIYRARLSKTILRNAF